MNNIPHVEQYAGPWVMEEQAFNTLREVVRTLDLSAHLAGVAQKVAAGGAAVEVRPDVEVTGDGIAVLEICGTLTKYGSSFASGGSTVALKKQVRSLRTDKGVLGAMIKIDSPGGNVSGVEDLAAEIRDLAAVKPVVARIEDTGASGGYWLALACPRIVCNTTAVVGSIGVFGAIYDSSAVAEKQGIKVHVIKEGEFKAIGVPGSKVTDAQLAELQRNCRETYDLFVGTVAAGRKLGKKAAEALADGRVHVGENARKMGLVDAVESYEATYAYLLAQVQGTGRGMGMMQKPAAGMLPKAQHKELSMSESTTTSAAPAAATLKELKAALPDATAEFREKCQEDGLTLAAAKDRYLDQLRAEHQAQAKELQELKAAKPVKPKGNPPLTTATDAPEQAQGGDAAGFKAAVEKNLAAGMPREKAWRQAVHDHSAGHTAYVREHNAAAGRVTDFASS